MNPPDKLILGLALVLALFAAANSAAIAEDPPAKPNILFVFSDDHAWQSIGAYQSRLEDIANTPNIDQLASEGMLFRKCYVTNALCGPSRATVLTGKYGHLNGDMEQESPLRRIATDVS